jgi:hypothetical protein
MTKIVRIESLFEHSAGRFLSDAQLQPDPALIAEGWERRFTADAHRAEEVMELYSQLGYEVRAEPVHSEEVHDDCTDCHSLIVSKFKTIYTRRRAL